MPRVPTTATSSGLVGLGLLAWFSPATGLIQNPDLNIPLNPMGINRSPYGEVLAMAMQSPIETYFHADKGGHHHHKPGEPCTDPDHHSHDQENDHEDAADASAETAHHDDHEEDTAATPTPDKTSPSPTIRLKRLLTSLSKLPEVRTNPKPASPALKFYLRRQIENKLRFAYNLDPAHYANYNTLHFFLTEPELGTRPELTSTTAQLANDTIHYCLQQQNDPRPALTAAAAAGNVLLLMFEDQRSQHPRFSTSQMRDYLNLMDHCLQRHQMIASQWDQSKNWDLLSPMRIQECKDRLHFILKIREAAEKTITNFEHPPSPPAIH